MSVREPQVEEYYWLRKFEPGVLLKGFRAAAARAGCSPDGLAFLAGFSPDYRARAISGSDLEAVRRLGGSPQWVHADVPGGFVSIGRGSATLWLKVLAGSERAAREIQEVLENELDLNPKRNTCMYCGRRLTEPEASYETRMRKFLNAYRTGGTVTREYLERKVVILRCRRCRSVPLAVGAAFALLSIVPAIFIAPAIPWIYEMGFLKYLIPWMGTYAMILPIQLLVLKRMGIRWSERGSPRCIELQADGWRHS